jgi:NAD(P)H dehydrogenase (quinone)
MKIALTGAAGELGRAVAAALLDRVAPDDLILVTRRPDQVAELAARGVRVRQADLDEPAGLSAAFSGADRLLLISTTHESTPRRVEQHTAAIDAARDAGVGHVVFTSMPKVDESHPTGVYAMEYPRTEAVLKNSGMAWTILQNGPYAGYLVGRFALAVRHGRLLSNAGGGRVAPVAHEDCAAVAAEVLTGEGHESSTYVVTGGELFTQRQLAEVLSTVVGVDIPLREVADDAMPGLLAGDGLPEPMPGIMTRHLKAVRLGYFDDLTAVVRDLTGTAPRSLRSVLEEHRGQLVAAVPAAVPEG